MVFHILRTTKKPSITRFFGYMVRSPGIEPGTVSLKGSCSANWAMSGNKMYYSFLLRFKNESQTIGRENQRNLGMPSPNMRVVKGVSSILSFSGKSTSIIVTISPTWSNDDIKIYHQEPMPFLRNQIRDFPLGLPNPSHIIAKRAKINSTEIKNWLDGELSFERNKYLNGKMVYTANARYVPVRIVVRRLRPMLIP